MAKTGDISTCKFCGGEIVFGRNPQIKTARKKHWMHLDGRLECAVCSACGYTGAKEKDLVGGPYAGLFRCGNCGKTVEPADYHLPEPNIKQL